MSANTILVLYVSVGYGHRNAALALQSALARLNPQMRTVVLDLLKLWRPWVVRVFCRGYRDLIKTFPGVWDYLYDRREIKKKLSRFIRFFYQLNRSRVGELLEEFDPAAVVCTQALPCGLVADLKASTGRILPLVAVPTDYVVHEYWLHEEVNLYLVPSPRSREDLLNRGVEPGRIKVVGIPVHPDFAVRHDRDALRKKYGFPLPGPTVMIMGGGEGLGPVSQLIRALDRRREVFQMAAVTGQNLHLHGQLRKLQERLCHPLRIFSLVDSIDELMGLSDLIVTKPGGLTTSEALVKDLPMILLNPLPGQETLNAGFLQNQGVAVRAKNYCAAAGLVAGLLNGDGRMDQMKAAIRVIKKPSAAAASARSILQVVNA